jgi:hypothetical protein
MPYQPIQQNTGSFVPTTNVWDVSEIYSVDVTSPEFKELIVRLYQNINNVSLVLNTKDSAFYLTEEFVNSQLWFNAITNDQLRLRPAFRMTVNTGALGAGVTTVAHGIAVDANTSWVYISGAATDSVNLLGYPITFGGGANNNIGVNANATNIIINNNSGQTFTGSVIVLEYLKF